MPRSGGNRPTNSKTDFKGLRLVDTDYEVQSDNMVVADNIDITREFKPKRRVGYVQKHVDTVNAAMTVDDGFFYISGATLKRYKGPSDVSSIRADLTRNDILVGTRFGDYMYYSNGVQTGVYDFVSETSRMIGIDRPAPVIASPLNAGQMRAGRYQIVCTFVRDDGLESGASPHIAVDLEDNDGINITSLPTTSASNISFVNIYCTTADGTQYFLAATVEEGTTSTTISTDPINFQKELVNQFVQKIPGFTSVEYFRGHMIYATGNILITSLPYGFELYDPRFDFITIDASEIRMLATVSQGIYVGTEEATYFLSGNTVRDFNFEKVHDSPVVRGTRRYVKAEYVGVESSEDLIPMWVTQEGICVGTGGTVTNVTSPNIDFPAVIRGSGVFRRVDGQNHYLAVVQT